MPSQIGIWQLLIIIGLVLLIFGAKRLPDTARALGKSMRILKSEASQMKKESGSPDHDGRADSADASETHTPRTIQAAPGDVASSRPVDEPRRTTQG
ncbi:Sec-independent protein translocase subunit TatA [Streptomyces sp. JJ66]|uniref:Sec-independent protein translocase subunit TatA n=1 Tax=Streptomyces sp. JJ66 TaxID=2803843 RepID=UPI001C587578|nr:Sec-independent protein translocase subunit TatA [Streptomyces sp. JJ66]MBW1602144.1 Sec-independent protein translocase subunit TatA [Streptomyces sp. JJ66]